MKDAFGNEVTYSARNLGDLASHYPYSPERWRIYLNGTRQLVEYGDITEFEDAVDSWILKPNAGDTMRYTTAERFRYIVGFELQPSFAYGFNRELQEGDKVIIGYGESDIENDMASADGWFFIYDGSMNNEEVEIATFRNGIKVASKIVNPAKSSNIWKRMEIEMNWYNVGAVSFLESYTVAGTQYNQVIGSLSVDDGKGPQGGNKKVEFAVKRGSGNDPLELECGSVAVKGIGDVSPTNRGKTFEGVANYGVAADEYAPIYAIRLKETHKLVNVQINNLRAITYGGSAKVKLLAIAVHNSKTDASNWTTPPDWAGSNNALEVTDNVSTMPNSSGNVVMSSADPGGYQIGFSIFIPASGNKDFEGRGASNTLDRGLRNGDVVLVLAKATDTGDVGFSVTTEQDW